jgi:hypothetical protein
MVIQVKRANKECCVGYLEYLKFPEYFPNNSKVVSLAGAGNPGDNSDGAPIYQNDR